MLLDLGFQTLLFVTRSTTTPLHSIFAAHILKSQIRHSEFSTFIKIKDDFISFSLAWGTLPHSLFIIGSTQYLNFPSHLSMRLVSQCFPLVYAPFSRNILPPICRDAHEELVSLSLHNILKAFIPTTPESSQHH